MNCYWPNERVLLHGVFFHCGMLLALFLFWRRSGRFDTPACIQCAVTDSIAGMDGEDGRTFTREVTVQRVVGRVHGVESHGLCLSSVEMSP
jgi:hypothetical protein